jgi:hypothetical protein
MAATGYTPILLFRSGTTTNTPTTSNLQTGELGINYTDGKLFYNNGSSIALIAANYSVLGAGYNAQSSAYVPIASDAGKIISITTGGITINNSVFSAGNILTIYNNSSSSQTITQGTGVTLQWSGQTSSTTGNRTLGLYGTATVFFTSASNAVISGAGLT